MELEFINIILIYVIKKVLFLGSGDLRNALLMASQCSAAYHKLDIHLSNSSDTITARNYLIIHLILSPDFDSLPGSADFQYLWDLWYSFQWSKATRKHFIKDVRKLEMDKAKMDKNSADHYRFVHLEEYYRFLHHQTTACFGCESSSWEAHLHIRSAS